MVNLRDIKVIALTTFGVFISISLFSLLLNAYAFNSGFRIGFPFTYYFQFQARGNDFKNFGFFIEKGVLNFFITLFFVCLIYIAKKRSKRGTSKK